MPSSGKDGLRSFFWCVRTTQNQKEANVALNVTAPQKIVAGNVDKWVKCELDNNDKLFKVPMLTNTRAINAGEMLYIYVPKLVNSSSGEPQKLEAEGDDEPPTKKTKTS